MRKGNKQPYKKPVEEDEEFKPVKALAEAKKKTVLDMLAGDDSDDDGGFKP